MKNIIYPIVILLLLVSCSTENNKGFDWNKNEQIEFIKLPVGEVMPSGWIKSQMQRDLKDGFAGHLDELTKRAGDSVFINQRSAQWDGNEWKEDPRFEKWKQMFRWWDGETEGNWRIGLVEMAYLSDEPAAIEKISSYLDQVVENSQKDGYIGMFAPDLRYKVIGDL